MICPICHKKEAKRIVVRRFSGTIVQGEVCENCYDQAISMGREGFYYTFLQQPELSCRFCGRKLSDIENTLLVGCQMCYKEFSTQLQPIIERLQGENDED